MNVIEVNKVNRSFENGKEVARFIPHNRAVSYLTDSLTGILKADLDPAQAKEEGLKEKYEIAD